MYPTAAEPWVGCFVRDQEMGLRRIGLDLDVLSFDGRAGRWAYAAAARALRRRLHRERFDVVHAHYGLTGAVALPQRRAPVLTTFWGSDTAIPWQRAVSWIVARATTPVFVSADAARRLGLRDVPVVPSAVDLDLFRPIERDEARTALGWSTERRYVLLPGSRSDPMKGSPLFDAAVALARGLVAELEPVSLEGFSREKTSLVMNAADVTLMSSLREGSPVAVKESLACLTPVVSVPVGDVPELLVGLDGCEVAPRDPAALAEAVVRALAAPRDLSLRARVEPFSNTRIAEQLNAIYEAVVGTGARRPRGRR
jgi:glycosyltransferase involved in cell wall biosynthesis